VAASAARLEDDGSGVLVQPEMSGLAQWTMADVPRLVDEGRRAAREALDADDRGAR
jgi:NTE family protein